jgi:hypothetical protein
MTPEKVTGRMEDVEWALPILTFVIERHGGTVLGSSRAELQQWRLDIDRGTRTLVTSHHRQLKPMRPRLDVTPAAEDLCRLVIETRPDPRLKWHADGSVQVLISLVIPANGPKQTVADSQTLCFVC